MPADPRDAPLAEGAGRTDPAAGFTSSQRAGLEARRVERDRTLRAVHDLEAALEAAGPRRPDRWRDEVVAALEVLAEATAGERRNAERPDSLLSEIARSHPRLRSRVHGVRAQYRHLAESIASLRRELEESNESAPDVADLRQRLGWVLTALRHQRARESDLIYEAYYEAFRAELGEESEHRGRTGGADSTR